MFRSPLLRRATLFALLLILVANALFYTPYVVDDAFISMRYAYHWATGKGLVFNPGEHVEGFSNFSWVVIETLLYLGQVDVLAGVKWIGTLSGVGMVLATYRLVRLLLPEEPASALFAAAFLAFNASLAVWCQAGLETSFFGFLSVALVLRRELEIRRELAFPGAALLFVLLWMTRPEAPIYGLYLALRRPQGQLVRDSVLCLALLLPYELYGWFTFGSLVPNTHAAKVGNQAVEGALDSWPILGDWSRRGFASSQLASFASTQGLSMMALLALALWGLVRAGLRHPALWAPLFSGLFFSLYAWSDWMPRFRFLVPVLPFLGLALALGFAHLGTGAARRLLQGVSAVLLLFYVHEQVTVPYARQRQRAGYTYAAEARTWDWPAQLGGRLSQPPILPMADLAEYLLRNTGPEDTVALGDIGLPGLVAGNPIYDLRGLVTPAAARARSGDPEAVAAAVEALFEDRPALLLLPPGKALAPLRKAIQAHPSFVGTYEQVPGMAAGLALWLRRDHRSAPGPNRVPQAQRRLPAWGRP